MSHDSSQVTQPGQPDPGLLTLLAIMSTGGLEEWGWGVQLVAFWD